MELGKAEVTLSSVVFWRGHAGTVSVDLLFAMVMPPFWTLPYVFWTKLISYCFCPPKWNCSPCGPLPLFMLAKTSGYWQRNLDGIHIVRGQGGKKGHTVALSAFACLAESMPIADGKKVTDGMRALLIGQETRQVLKFLDPKGTLDLVRCL